MYIDISARDWAFAALLGEARRKSNESIRKTHRDRGNVNNIHIDLMGSISEILAVKYFWKIMTRKERELTSFSMFRPEGGAGKLGADLVLSERELKLDVKTFDCQSNKRFFAINHSKHKDLSGECSGYVCVICPKYSTKAYFIDFVPYNDVSSWPLKSLGSYGDSSHNMPIYDFLNKYAERDTLKKLQQVETYSRNIIAEEINKTDTREIFHHFFIGSDRFVRRKHDTKEAQ